MGGRADKKRDTSERKDDMQKDEMTERRRQYNKQRVSATLVKNKWVLADEGSEAEMDGNEIIEECPVPNLKSRPLQSSTQ